MKLTSGTAAALLLAPACSDEPNASASDTSSTSVEAGAASSSGADVHGAVPGGGERSGSEGSSAAANIGGAQKLVRIPAAFRGTWARSAGNCGLRDHNRFTLSGDAVRFFGGGGPVRDIRRDGNALAVSYSERTPANDSVQRPVYFALEGDGQMRVRLGEDESLAYRRCPAAALRDEGSTQSQASPVVPDRFRGLYALDRRACEEDYAYNAAFQNVTVGAREVSFFETGGPITDVNVDENSIAITLRETVGDGEFTRAIYLSLNDDGTVRYRPEGGAPVEAYLRCGE